MFNVPSFFGFRSGGGFDPDYQAVLDYATTQVPPYTLPSLSQQVLQNQLVIDLKDAGIWSKLDTFGVFATDAEDSPGSGTSNFALIDWKRLIQYTAVNSPTFTTNDGFLSNGTSSYIDTNYNPSTSGVNFTLNNACFGGVRNTATNIDGFFVGCSVSLANCLKARLSTANRINQSTVNSSPSGNFEDFYFVGLHRNSSSEVAYGYNDTIVTAVSSSISIPNANQWILRAASHYAIIGARMYFSGSNLILEQSDFFNAWNNYYNAL
jgi:hypothetical protein